jgi:putative endonuclease
VTEHSTKAYYVYLAVSASGTLYTGVTGNIARRAQQHATANGGAFTSKYHVNRIVHVEVFEEPVAAIEREKQIKGWRREKKIVLVDRSNPKWRTIELG